MKPGSSGVSKRFCVPSPLGAVQVFAHGRLFQDIGQIVRNFDQATLQGFLGSAQLRQFFGVRDYETAKLISSMLGDETLTYDETLHQSEARMRKQDLARGLFEGRDPFENCA